MERNYPSVPARPVVDNYFGTAVTDPYRYLEVRDSEETKAVVAAENAYTKAFFAAHPGHDVAAYEQALRQQQPLHDISSIAESGGKIAGVRDLPGSTHEIVALNADYEVDHVILNEEMMGGSLSIYSVIPCPAEKPVYAIIGVYHGHPRCACILWDDEQKKELAALDGLFAVNWTEDGKALLFDEAQVDTANNRNIDTVYRYEWESGKKTALYQHPGNAVMVTADEGPRGGVLLTVKQTYTDDLVLWMDAQGDITRLNEGACTWDYLGKRGERLYFRTNWQAPFGRVVYVEEAQLSEESALHRAAIAIPEQDCLLDDCLVQGKALIAFYQRNACAEALVFDDTGKELRKLSLPDAYGRLFLPGKSGASGRKVYFNYQSFLIRPSIYQLDTETFEIRPILGDPDPCDDLTVDACFLKARDGQQILVYIVRQKEQQPDGKTPLLMYGYGGYASSNSPMAQEVTTSYRVAEWVRMGRIYAHCILRGGLEYGTAWHEAAMKDTKKNAFFDFIDIAEYLIAEGWTSTEQLIATGVSNGGLLMTAITTLRPDLFGTVIASVPHTDMLRFRNDDRGMMYITEYGDPLESEAMFRYMYSYSPYHNIHSGTVYPWIYVQTGEMDNNVPPYHGKKFAVRLQAEADPENPVLLTVLAHGSHNRGTGDEYYRNTAQIRAFLEISLDAHRSGD